MRLHSRARRRYLPRALAVGVALASCARPAPAGVLLTPEQAVREAFPGAETSKRTDYLTEDQAAQIRDRAGSPPSSRIVLSWSAAHEGRILGHAYLDTHLVRTQPESILVVLEPAGTVRRIDILTFDEPADYLPKPRWLAQFEGRPMSDDLTLRGSIRAITGATLSSRAITAAVRRVLAAHAVLGRAAPALPPAAEPGAPPAPPPGEHRSRPAKATP